MTPQEALRDKLVRLYGSEAGAATYESLLPMLEPVRPGSTERVALSEEDVILIAYADHMQAADERPLQTLGRFLREVAPVNAVHLLPFYPYSSDDGFSVIDYYAVEPGHGTWEDVEALGADFRLMFDFVCNHISAQSEWFRKFRAGEAPFTDYFITVPPETDLSQVVRPRALPLLTPVETATGTRHVWTTFSPDQIDLNYETPAVLVEMLKVLRFYIERGASLIRLDAVAFLWKDIGTSSIHLPQTHLVIQLMRDFLNVIAPDTILITETNVPHEENISYFGDGYSEAQMVYQFPLPPLVLHTLATGDASALTRWAQSLEAPGAQATFFNFTASHDGIGMRPATGLLSDAEVTALVERAQAHGGRVSYKTNSDGSQSPYELNITYFDAVTDPAITVEGPRRAAARFIVSQAIALALQGVPGIYLPSLFGGRNWQAGVEQTGHNRTINREKYRYDALRAQLQAEGALAQTVYQQYRALLHIRRGEPAFHPLAPQIIHDLSPQVFAVERRSLDGRSRVLALHSVSQDTRTVPLSPGEWELLQAEVAPIQGEVRLRPFSVCWLRQRN